NDPVGGDPGDALKLILEELRFGRAGLEHLSVLSLNFAHGECGASELLELGLDGLHASFTAASINERLTKPLGRTVDCARFEQCAETYDVAIGRLERVLDNLCWRANMALVAKQTNMFLVERLDRLSLLEVARKRSDGSRSLRCTTRAASLGRFLREY